MVSPFFGIAPANSNNNTKEDDTRQKEFENTIGNLLVAEYQCHRLRERVKSHLLSRELMRSEFMFKMGNEWFRINISAQRQEEVQPEEEKKAEPEEPATAFEAWFPDETVGVP